MARQPGEVTAVEFPLDALLQAPHHIPLGIGGGVAENPHVAAPAEVLAVDEVGSDDPLDLSRSLVRSQVGIRPSVSPLCGSVSIAGMGMNGAVAGSNQRMSPDGAGAGAAGAGGAAAASAPPAPRAVASSASAHTVQQPVDLRRDLDTLASALWVPSIGALDTGGSEPRRGPSRLMVSLVHRSVPHPAACGGGTMLRPRRVDQSAGDQRRRTENHSAYKLIVGFRPLSLIGAEIAYMDFGHPGRSFSPGSTTSADVKMSGAAGFGMLYL